MTASVTTCPLSDGSMMLAAVAAPAVGGSHQRRMGTLLPKKLLSCRPRNDGPYDGPRVPSTLHRAPSTGGGAVTQPDNT